jgi:glycosyltransferase involved in cell wall biosynthesis
VKIVVVSAFYSEGMGYTENCLPRALAVLGHEVHVITSCYNVYGNESAYKDTYQSFLGPAIQKMCTYESDGYMVHRLKTRSISNYVWMQGMREKIKMLSPDVVHCLEIASIPSFLLALCKPFMRYKLFCETHQHLSVVRPYLKEGGGHFIKRLGYWMTRTFPTKLASLAVEKCYAIAPDCAHVARVFYGVPPSKIALRPLGADTVLFHPPQQGEETDGRKGLRESLGFLDDDIVCVYTGRFSADKNPVLLAKAIEILNEDVPCWKALFVGEGCQHAEIDKVKNVTVVPFMTHEKLAEFYRAVDIAVWPCQESMSMLDAASSGLPLVVSNRIGDRARVDGNGEFYEENNVTDMANVLRQLYSSELRMKYGESGRRKMEAQFSWLKIAAQLANDYYSVLEKVKLP